MDIHHLPMPIYPPTESTLKCLSPQCERCAAAGAAVMRHELSWEGNQNVQLQSINNNINHSYSSADSKLTNSLGVHIIQSSIMSCRGDNGHFNEILKAYFTMELNWARKLSKDKPDKSHLMDGGRANKFIGPSGIFNYRRVEWVHWKTIWGMWMKSGEFKSISVRITRI